MRRLTLATLVVLGSLLLQACGGSGGGSTTTTTETTTETGGSSVVPDAGCDTSSPYRQSVTPAEAGTLVQICADAFRSEETLRNVSSTVLTVFARSQDGVDISMPVPSDQTFGDAAAWQAVGASCFYSSCTVPHGGVVYASSRSAITFSFQPNDNATVEANAASAAVGWALAKLPTIPGQSLVQKAAACGQGAGDLMSQNLYWTDAVRGAITTSTACSGLVDEVRSRDPALREPQLADEVISVAKGFDHGLWVDELALELAHVIK